MPLKASRSTNNEAIERIKNLKLTNEKLELETKILQHQRSAMGVLLEWLKAGALPAAIITVFVSLLLGIEQIRQQSLTRENQRIEKNISLLVDSNRQAKLAGVAGLGLFFRSDYPAFHDTVLQYLVSTYVI